RAHRDDGSTARPVGRTVRAACGRLRPPCGSFTRGARPLAGPAGVGRDACKRFPLPCDMPRAARDGAGSRREPHRLIHIRRRSGGHAGRPGRGLDHARSRFSRTPRRQTQEPGMKQSELREFAALKRSRAFVVTNATKLGALATSDGSKQLDDAIARIDTLTNDQATANLDMIGLASREEFLSKEIKNGHMNAISDFARAKLRGAPDFAALVRPVSSLRTTAQVVTAARAMATAAAPHADALTAGGLP